MLSSFCLKFSQNKNLLMLLTPGIYMLALFATFSNHLLLVSFLFTAMFIFALAKNLFPIKYIITWTLIFYLGVINTSSRLRETDDLLNLAPVNSEISGTVLTIPQGKIDGKLKFYFDVNSIKFGTVNKKFKDEKVLASINYDEKNPIDIRLYDSLTMNGRLSAPFKAGNPSQFDYGNYLRNHNAYAVFYAKTFNKVEKEKHLKAKFLQGINNYRENILSIHSKYLESPYLEILGGIVFGDDAVSPPKEIKQSFVNSGLLHILAASGMNVAFIYGFFYWIMSLLRVDFRLKVVLGMIMVLIYTMMTGMGASILRATGMLMFVLIGKLIDRDAHSISLLSFVGLLMLIYNPMYINEVGFQLSFLVTFGILIMAPAIMRFNNRLLDYISGTITIPVIAQLWVIPIQIFYFSNISLYSIFANIMSTPLLAVISFGGFVSSLISGIAPIADLVCRIFDFVLNPFLRVLVNISDFWGHLPNSAIQTTHPSEFQIILYYGILLCFTSFFYKDFRDKYFRKIIITFVALVLIWLVTLIPIKNSNLEILTFDVGNADCFLIKTPNNEHIIIDTGRAGYNRGKSQAEIILLKYLKDKGIKHINSVIVTHFDNDHCGGAEDILKKVNVDKIYVNDLSHNSIAAKSIYKTAKEVKAELIQTENNQVIFNNSGLKLTNLLGVSTDDDNENSIITLLEYNNFSMLFTGDAGIIGIKSVLSSVPKNITILKVPHHGAIGGLDKDLVSYLNPEYSIISVGENYFGHPSDYIIKLLDKSKILRTDVNNAIYLKINKNKLKLYEFDLNKKQFIKVF